MSYLSKENSVQDGSPIHLLHFSQGVLNWRYTTASYPIIALGHIWNPSPITQGGVNQSNDMTRDTLSLRFPRDHEFARIFLAYTPDQLTSVTLYRGHEGESEFIVYWKGRIASTKSGGETISVECEPVFTSLRRPGLRARYQRTCRHAHYGRGCNLDPEDWATSGICTEASGVQVVVPQAALFSAGYFIGGMIESPDGVLRHVIEHSGSLLTLIRPIESLILEVGSSGYGRSYGENYGGVPVRIFPGCDHSRFTCESKFNNLDNNGSFPWIPEKNPFGGSSIA